MRRPQQATNTVKIVTGERCRTMSDNTRPEKAYDASEFEPAPARQPFDLLVGPTPRHAAPRKPCRVNVAALLADIKRRLSPQEQQALDDVLDVVQQEAADAAAAEGWCRGINVNNSLVPPPLLDALIAGTSPGRPPVELVVDGRAVAVTLADLAPNRAPDAATVWSRIGAAVREVANDPCRPAAKISDLLPPEVARVTYIGDDGRTVRIAARGSAAVLQQRARWLPGPWKGGAAGIIPLLTSWGPLTAGGTAALIGGIVAFTPAAAMPHRAPDAGGSMFGKIPQAASATRGRHPLRSPVTVTRPPTRPAPPPSPAPASTPRTTPAPSGGPSTPPPPAPTPAQSPTAQPPAGDPEDTATPPAKKPKRRRHRQHGSRPEPAATRQLPQHRADRR